VRRVGLRLEGMALKLKAVKFGDTGPNAGAPKGGASAEKAHECRLGTNRDVSAKHDRKGALPSSRARAAGVSLPVRECYIEGAAKTGDRAGARAPCSIIP
jgi:hypothetical protein